MPVTLPAPVPLKTTEDKGSVGPGCKAGHARRSAAVGKGHMAYMFFQGVTKVCASSLRGSGEGEPASWGFVHVEQTVPLVPLPFLFMHYSHQYDS